MNGMNEYRNRRMRSRSRNRNKNSTPTPQTKLDDALKKGAINCNFVPHQQKQICYEGESLARLLKSIQREIESARVLDRSLPNKIWLKQQFSIGINDVTRVLERMPLMGSNSSHQKRLTNCSSTTNTSTCNHIAPPARLQAILLSSDFNPRWLTKHLPSMASLRKVPLIFVKDNKGGSLRLGELVKLKTAIAIGVKAKGNAINQLIEEVISGTEWNNCPNSSDEMLAARSQ